ncbi:hypothetical protein SLEP1_g56574 [Rubroshorea leprosula]|uniref:Uncharacterized protein n=1 Tax=Rubroshorea leprosula TaxID=152421 RepID=A0AAV5MK07_9ROSI|nr:hypothetical protein SLEP1_g56574 [Rubroshorea leprosula]
MGNPCSSYSGASPLLFFLNQHKIPNSFPVFFTVSFLNPPKIPNPFPVFFPNPKSLIHSPSSSLSSFSTNPNSLIISVKGPLSYNKCPKFLIFICTSKHERSFAPPLAIDPDLSSLPLLFLLLSLCSCPNHRRNGQILDC